MHVPGVGRVRGGQAVKPMLLKMPYEQWRRKVHVFNHNQIRYGTETLKQA
jgi:hypothetical protein